MCEQSVLLAACCYLAKQQCNTTFKYSRHDTAHRADRRAALHNTDAAVGATRGPTACRGKHILGGGGGSLW